MWRKVFERSSTRPRLPSFAPVAASNGRRPARVGSAPGLRRWTSAPPRRSSTHSPGCRPTRTSATCRRLWPRSSPRRARSSSEDATAGTSIRGRCGTYPTCSGRCRSRSRTSRAPAPPSSCPRPLTCRSSPCRASSAGRSSRCRCAATTPDCFTLDLDAIDDAFRRGGHLLIFCNPYNPLGRVFTADEMAQLSGVVEARGGRVFADEIHGPLAYPGMRHIPYASTSAAAAAHTLTATSASKAWNLPGLKCAQVVLSSEADRRHWDELAFFATHGASSPGVVANIAAYTHGEAVAGRGRRLSRRQPSAARGSARPAPATGALPRRRTAPTSPGSTAPHWTCPVHPARSSPNAPASRSWTGPRSARAAPDPSGSTSPHHSPSWPRWWQRIAAVLDRRGDA